MNELVNNAVYNVDKAAIERTIAALRRNNYEVSFFPDAEAAALYLDEQIDGTTVGFGDSVTLFDMKLFERLSRHNKVADPQHRAEGRSFNDTAKDCLTREVFLTSVNAAAETGELVNIDGTGNRVAGSLFGHRKVYFVLGVNKIAPTLAAAIERARNVAAPLNAKRHGFNTPCAVRGDRCYDCSSPDRICNCLIIHYKKMRHIEMEVILIGTALGL